MNNEPYVDVFYVIAHFGYDGYMPVSNMLITLRKLGLV